MTTLRTFQDEIEEIHHREVAKKRAQVLSDRKEKEKDVKKSTGAVLTGSDKKEKDAKKPRKNQKQSAGNGKVVCFVSAGATY